MGFAVTYARAQVGIDAPLVTVEADISQGLPQIQIVGLPATAVKEAKDRVKAAIVNAGFKTPSRRVTVNLAPADLPKQGGRYDLAIALAILAANGELPAAALAHHEWLGELALDGKLRAVHAILPAALQSLAAQRTLVIPQVNAAEAGFITHLQGEAVNSRLRLAGSLLEVVNHLVGQQALPAATATEPGKDLIADSLDDVRGQAQAKRALMIAAAGGHNLLLIGPPGSGKTMLARRLAGLLPPLSAEESLAVAAVHCLSSNTLDPGNWIRRPVRTPHHTCSAAALAGGGNPPVPGEISLAHLGVLFLDELPEFSRRVLEVLREPMESGEVMLSRAGYQLRYPARFQLVAAMNPCPCGYLGDTDGRCECRIEAIARYQSRISGPLMDRIDLHVTVPAVAAGMLTRPDPAPRGASQQTLIANVSAARNAMLKRSGVVNAQLSQQALGDHCSLTASDTKLLEKAMIRLRLSARGHGKLLRVARTIADLAGDAQIQTPHLIEAIAYRNITAPATGQGGYSPSTDATM